MAEGGEVFHLDMGRPMKIHDLAVRMISLAGYVPGRDIELREIGLRPGEKLEEELQTASASVTTSDHPKVYRATEPPGDPAALARLLDELAVAAQAGDEAATLRLLARLVPEYAPTNETVRAILGS
jgi:FlaA1/EpsC-like NDP-sugar epimerase